MTPNRKPSSEIPGWSWITAALGLLLVVGAAGFMVYQAFASEHSPPAFTIEAESTTQLGETFLVEIRVLNHGGSVAAGLVVEGVVRSGVDIVETSTVTLDYVPAGSERKAGLLFDRDPRKFVLQLKAKGYAKP